MKAVLHCPPPPLDGTPFLAEVRVLLEDAAGLSVYPLVGRMQFAANGELVWYLGQLAIRTYADAEIHVDRWHPAPASGRTFAWLRDPRAEADTYDYACDDGGGL